MPPSARRPKLTPETFYRFVDRRGRGCWKWRGLVDANGIACVHVDGRRVVAHHYMWLRILGLNLEPGQRLYRTCRNRTCARPEHLDLDPRRRT